MSCTMMEKTNCTALLSSPPAGGRQWPSPTCCPPLPVVWTEILARRARRLIGLQHPLTLVVVGRLLIWLDTREKGGKATKDAAMEDRKWMRMRTV
jgi:hypothetical protein